MENGFMKSQYQKTAKGAKASYLRKPLKPRISLFANIAKTALLKFQENVQNQDLMNRLLASSNPYISTLKRTQTKEKCLLPDEVKNLLILKEKVEAIKEQSHERDLEKSVGIIDPSSREISMEEGSIMEKDTSLEDSDVEEC
ncbi:hypothetical protein HHI36_008212 [Cryptolaemus montrouzieri]|uniref:Uncharacterized protein n=1 Tax=Cryptolaemus montrouzieri TaxID=559131 RepID=A0ABD2MRP9_9CUCU